MLPELNTLFLTNTINIGSVIYIIRPYTIEELFEVTARLKAMKDILQNEDVALDNFSSVQSILTIISDSYFFVQKEICSIINISDRDFGKLPLEIVVSIIDKIIEINLQSKELFENHLQKLGGKTKSDSDSEAEIAKAIQKLVANGHSWSSIQQYSLAEIGIFLKVIIEQEREDRAEELSHLWMGANLTYEGLKDVMSTITKKPQDTETSVKEVHKEWKRLASFMNGKK